MNQAELLSVLSAQITTRKKHSYTNKDNMELLRTCLRSRKLDKIIDSKVLEELRKLLKVCCSSPEVEDHWLVLVQNFMLKHADSHTDVQKIAAD